MSHRPADEADRRDRRAGVGLRVHRMFAVGLPGWARLLHRRRSGDCIARWPADFLERRIGHAACVAEGRSLTPARAGDLAHADASATPTWPQASSPCAIRRGASNSAAPSTIEKMPSPKLIALEFISVSPSAFRRALAGRRRVIAPFRRLR